MKNVVPFKQPEVFAAYGIHSARPPVTNDEGALREAYLTYESSCGPEGLVSLLLLATVTRREGAVAQDLQDAADFAEILLVTKLGKHRINALNAASLPLATEVRYGVTNGFLSAINGAKSHLRYRFLLTAPFRDAYH